VTANSCAARRRERSGHAQARARRARLSPNTGRHRPRARPPRTTGRGCPRLAAPRTRPVRRVSGRARRARLDGVIGSHVQHQQEPVSYVFSGPGPSLLRELFAEHARPLYSEALRVCLGRIDASILVEPIRRNFVATGKDAGPLRPCASDAPRARSCSPGTYGNEPRPELRCGPQTLAPPSAPSALSGSDSSQRSKRMSSSETPSLLSRDSRLRSASAAIAS
jgi:hypothetical protein